MKVGILTHYNVNNQGAQLQMYAMSKIIEEMGFEPVILTYNKNFDFVSKDEKNKNIVSISSIPYFIKEYIMKKGIGITYFNYKKYTKNKKFRKNNFIYKRYSEANVDYAIVGSDEVFSIPMGVNIMMYGHCVNTKRMIAYAPSFGQTNIELINRYNAKELISSGLAKFKDLSARDENTKKIIKELTGRESTLVCDPVLLYDFKNTHTKFKKIPNKKYIIIYAYDRHMIDKDEIQEIKKYAKKKGLITVSAGTYHKWCDKNISCNCLEWIELFRNAEQIITDTFHGTILSTITEKPMAIYVRDSINKNKLTYLLKQLKLEDRKLEKITCQNIEKVFSKNMEYQKINTNLENLRNISRKYLKGALDLNE